jgi:hypothetical protein
MVEGLVGQAMGLIPHWQVLEQDRHMPAMFDESLHGNKLKAGNEVTADGSTPKSQWRWQPHKCPFDH